MLIVIIDQPTIDRRSLQIVNESEKISLTRDIVSNPVSNVSWYYGSQLLKTQPSVTTATYTVENTTCIDTKNYTLLVSNGIGNTVTARVDLIVNCKILISLNLLQYICVIVVIVVLLLLLLVIENQLFYWFLTDVLSLYCTLICTNGNPNLYRYLKTCLIYIKNNNTYWLIIFNGDLVNMNIASCLCHTGYLSINNEYFFLGNNPFIFVQINIFFKDFLHQNWYAI